MKPAYPSATRRGTSVPSVDEGEGSRDSAQIAALKAELKELRDQVAQSRECERRLTLALESTDVGVWDWDIKGDSFWVSPNALAMQGFRDVSFSTFRETRHYFASDEEYQAWRDKIVSCLKGEIEVVVDEHQMIAKDGDPVWIMERARVVARGEDGRAHRMIGTRTNTTKRREAEERLRWMAHHDPLTGLSNRTLFENRLQQALAGAGERNGFAGLIFIDIDHFKRVNDIEGHDKGDELLKSVAECLKDLCGKPNTVARMGGDEFGIVLPELKSAEELEEIAACIADWDTGVGLSVGAALYPLHGCDERHMRLAADAALYHAKRRGRSCAVLFESKR